MNLPLLLGLGLGVLLAVADLLVCKITLARAAKEIDQAARILRTGFVARYLLVAAILLFGLLIPGVNALGVILPLLLQKALWVAWTVWKG